MPDLDPDVRAYHERGEEAARLTEKNPIEFVRTTQILSRVLPPAPAHIVDVGGGPGAYARWLCARDYEVELVDPVALHIEQANEPGTPGLTARIGDGRHLDIGNEATDAVLLMGPLYHLTDTDDRVTTLRECWRILRPGGVVVAAAINRWAPLFDVVIREALDPAAFGAWWETPGETGNQRAADAPGFTTAHFHRPADLRSEVARAGFRDIDLVGVEGCTLFLRDHVERMADPPRRDLLLAAASAIEDEPDLAGLSAHILAIGRKEPRATIS